MCRVIIPRATGHIHDEVKAIRCLFMAGQSWMINESSDLTTLSPQSSPFKRILGH